MSDGDFRLIGCDANGVPHSPIADLPQDMVDACEATAALYRRIGFEPPWTGYIAVANGTAVGGGAFVGPPDQNRVEIAYFTLPDQQGRGYARRTAEQLVSIARATDPKVDVSAKTAPEHNASTIILSRLGFERVGSTPDDDIGEAWLWLLR